MNVQRSSPTCLHAIPVESNFTVSIPSCQVIHEFMQVMSMTVTTITIAVHPIFPSRPMPPISSHFIFQNNNYFLETHLILLSDSIHLRRLHFRPMSSQFHQRDRFTCHGISDSRLTNHPWIMSSCHTTGSTHHDDQSTFSYWQSIMIKIARSNKSISQILRTINFAPCCDRYPIAIQQSISIHVMWFHFHLRREVSYQVHLYISYYKK